VFDEARSRGADLRLKLRAQALVTVGPRMCKDKLMQAAGRMRLLDKGQTLLFAGTAEVTRKIRESMAAVGGAPIEGHTEVSSTHLLQWVMLNTVDATAGALPEWGRQGALFATGKGQSPELAGLDEVLDLEPYYAHAMTPQTVAQVCMWLSVMSGASSWYRL
jgi:hypothetical protein